MGFQGKHALILTFGGLCGSQEITAKVVEGKITFEKTLQVKIKNKKAETPDKAPTTEVKETETGEVGGKEWERRGRKKSK